jgi:hypothetical protein
MLVAAPFRPNQSKPGFLGWDWDGRRCVIGRSSKFLQGGGRRVLRPWSVMWAHLLFTQRTHGSRFSASAAPVRLLRNLNSQGTSFILPNPRALNFASSASICLL